MKPLLYLLLLLNVTACKKKEPPVATRSFYMGVTPYPADFTEADLNNTYNFINQHCDIVSHHFDEGIPYEEAYTNSSWPAGLLDAINIRLSKTAAGKKIFLSSSSLDLTRKAKAPYSRFSTVDAATKTAWEKLPVNDPKVITAYTNFMVYLVETMHPSFINYGVESNEASWDAAGFAQYKEFLSKVFTALKKKYPSIPIMVSMMVTEQPQGLDYAAQLLPYTDYIALSAYPYIQVSSSASGNTDPALFPADLFTRFINLDAARPFCFAETGYTAEPLVIPAYHLNKQGTAAWQNAYLETVCNLLNERQGKMLIWFCSKDYDAGNARLKTLNLYADIFGLWQDIGLLDENNNQRPAYNTWLNWMSRALK